MVRRKWRGSVSFASENLITLSLSLFQSLERGESNLGATKNALPAHKIFRAIFPSPPAFGWNRVTTTLCVAKRLLRGELSDPFLERKEYKLDLGRRE